MNNVILGTVISSVLTYDQLCAQLNEDQSVNPQRSSYAPCDGRSIIGSGLNKSTKGAIRTSPDLRGKFLRGLNTMYSVGEPLPFFSDTDGDPEDNRVVMSPQSDSFKKHDHKGGAHSHPWNGSGTVNDWGYNVAVGGGNIGDRTPPSSGKIIEEEGGDETRPRNIAVYFYIKIN
ncbi:hypothetical protein OGH69_11545 [Flavobacterium sp. MFBS3-15]|uniref:hypothetical protein n=1 Tax=Flavobacterium sp. MFBS3-15 TaxID=2989816 RepID=UPI00223579F9|nr:hypothetical protein [Flavobacterium sp. MFBS3-15]MCW4469603.1 hypothetical protein [Flavobacterium sp. MFBS3-15]